ncbi:myosin-6-like isoform X1 [Mercenaria mercenaria]|uniref:myosin-6-like isoform X1 n=1 Tax=Mercenaria mercenaria TaxID=6596 RepID=UPI00234E7622|nr:myosin-6-like isoform X1 [Mercenaria mercenaria]
MDEFQLLLSFFLPCLVWTLSTFVIMGCIRSCFARDNPQLDVCKQYNAVTVIPTNEDIQRLENKESLKQNYDDKTKEFGYILPEERKGLLNSEVSFVDEENDTVMNRPEPKTHQRKKNEEEYKLLEIFGKENSQMKKDQDELYKQLIDQKEKYENELKVKREQLSSKENAVVTERKKIQAIETEHIKAVEQITKELMILEEENSQLKKGSEESKQYLFDQTENYENDLKVKQEQLSSKKEDEVVKERKEMDRKTQELQELQELETKYKETVEQITKESKKLENENSQLKKDLEELKHLFDQTKNYEDDLKVKQEQLSSKEDELIKERNEMTKKIQELQELETKYKEIVKQIKESKISFNRLEEEHSKLKEDFAKAKRDIAILTEKYEHDLKETKDQLSSNEEAFNRFKEETVKEKHEQNSSFKANEDKLKKQLQEHEEEKIRLEKEIENVRNSKESEIRAIVAERNKIAYLYNAIKSQKSTHESAKNAYEREGVENMNDEFSNSKLAAKFTEIEKEEWLNAFESLQGAHGELSAIKRISFLMSQAYLLCIQSSDNATRVLLGLDENDKLPPQIETNVSEARREQLQHEHMKKEIVESVLKDSQDRSTELRVFLHKYVECCLLLVISRPEIKLYFDVKGMCYDGELKRRFRKYCTGSPVVKSGVQADTVIEVVWPELNDHCGIHRKGIIVAVAQRLDC